MTRPDDTPVPDYLSLLRLDGRKPLQERLQAGGRVFRGAASRSGQIGEPDLHGVNATRRSCSWRRRQRQEAAAAVWGEEEPYGSPRCRFVVATG